MDKTVYNEDWWGDANESQFPTNGSDNIDKMQDVTADDLTLLAQFNSCIASNNKAGADLILANNPQLTSKIFNAMKYNKLRDAIVRTQRFFLEEVQDWVRTLVTYKNEWQDNVQYDKFQVVTYINKGAIESYECLVKPPIGTPPTDNNYWVARTLRGEKGEPGLGLTPRGAWNRVPEYKVNDFVSHKNVLYYAVNDNNQSEPTEENGESTNSNWVCAMVLRQAADVILMPYGKNVADILNGLYMNSFNDLIDEDLYYEYLGKSTDENGNPVNTEVLKRREDGSIYSTKTSTKLDGGKKWTITTICATLGFNKTTTLEKTENGWISR